jgi:undecaprenyl-diphosphatase
MPMEFLISILPIIQDFKIFGYWLALFIALSESLPFIGLIIPGTVLITFFGFFSGKGYLDIEYLILFSSIGAMLGDGIGYYLGTKGTKFFSHENKLFKLSHLEKAQVFFKKYGNKSVFLGRFISPIRPIVPFVAGLSQMDKKVFLFWIITSGILWAISFLLFGYFFGEMLSI